MYSQGKIWGRTSWLWSGTSVCVHVRTSPASWWKIGTHKKNTHTQNNKNMSITYGIYPTPPIMTLESVIIQHQQYTVPTLLFAQVRMRFWFLVPFSLISCQQSSPWKRLCPFHSPLDCKQVKPQSIRYHGIETLTLFEEIRRKTICFDLLFVSLILLSLCARERGGWGRGNTKFLFLVQHLRGGEAISCELLLSRVVVFYFIFTYSARLKCECETIKKQYTSFRDKRPKQLQASLEHSRVLDYTCKIYTRKNKMELECDEDGVSK